MIWITGASTGIGASCAIEAAKLGAKLVLSARNETLLKEIKQKCLGKYHMDGQICIKFGAVGPLPTLKSLIEKQTGINEQGWEKISPCLLFY